MFNKITTFLFLLVFSLTIYGCEDNKENERQAIVEKGPARVLQSNQNRSVFVMPNGWTVKITAKTEILRQRDSCSGFDRSGIYGIDLKSDYIIYYYDLRNTDNFFEAKTVFASKIVAYRSECLYPPKPEKEIPAEPCPCPDESETL